MEVKENDALHGDSNSGESNDRLQELLKEVEQMKPIVLRVEYEYE